MGKAQLKSCFTILFVFAAMHAADRQSAKAQTRPFRVKGAGVVEFVPSMPNQTAKHDAKGTATYLGRYSGDGVVQLLDFIDESSAHFQSAEPFVFRGKNKTLTYHYGRPDKGASRPGIVRLFPLRNGKVIAIWDAEFTLDAPSGRVTASRFRMIAVTKPFVFGASDPVRYFWRGAGWIRFARR